jgi:hypothetical protein
LNLCVQYRNCMPAVFKGTQLSHLRAKPLIAPTQLVFSSCAASFVLQRSRREGYEVKRASTPCSPTCESCLAINVRDWKRRGLLHPGQMFPVSWNRAGVPCGSISVRTETEAVVLIFRSQHPGETEWKSTEQRVPILWTACHLGGRRPWFRCAVYLNGQHCGRRVAVLYPAGDLFACRHCYGLSYASQQESPQSRFIRRSRNTRMRLGGSPDLLQPFPERPRGMHQRTYTRLQARDLLLLKASVGALHERLSR